jgi:peptidoglycan/LPS O-acetylase OafA/YrhL
MTKWISGSGAAPEETPPWLHAGRIPSLDGVRAVAALLVVYAHAAMPGHHHVVAHLIKTRCGFLGVQIFFVLSGFLITTLMLREVARTGGLDLRMFYVRRFLRIIPAYAALLLVIAALQAFGRADLNSRDWLAALTYTVNFQMSPLPREIYHAWSLSVEEHFYLLWPLLMATCSLAGCRKAVLGCILGCLIFRWTVLLGFDQAPARVVDLWTFARMDDIGMGCLLAFLASDPAWRRHLDRIGGRKLLLVLAGGGLALNQMLCTRYVGARLLPPAAFRLAAGLSNDVNAAGIALLLWAVMRFPSGWAGRLLNTRPMCAIGAASYSLYLWHVLFGREDMAFLDVFPLNVLLMIAAAFASYHLIEKPVLAWKDRWSRAPAAARPAAPHVDRRNRPVRISPELVPVAESCAAGE